MKSRVTFFFWFGIESSGNQGPRADQTIEVMTVLRSGLRLVYMYHTNLMKRQRDLVAERR